ncbi:MAG: efflux RND transporter periplasmic adaptor subunit, partial [Oligosphaeraceae bacterium]|nr:efflux RND transporter periplasmic adaptor subunit [Oligosphaeraceae bacterium]
MKIQTKTIVLTLLCAGAAVLLLASSKTPSLLNVLNPNREIASQIVNPAADHCTDHDHHDHQEKATTTQLNGQAHDHQEGRETAHQDEDGHGHEYAEGAILLSASQQHAGGLQIAAAQTGELSETLEMIGEIRLDPVLIAQVVPQVAGFVRSLAVQAGDTVRTGQELLTLFSPELAELKCDFREKQRAAVLAGQIFARKDRLRQENIGLEADWQEAKFNLDNALAAQDFAAQRLLSLGLPQSVLTELGTQSPDRYGLYTVTAPMDGVVLEQHTALGSRTENENIMTIADLRMVRADFQVPTRHLRNLRTGQKVQVSALDGTTAQGEIALLSQQVNAANQTVRVSVTITNQEGGWRPGLFVRGETALPGLRTALLVPTDAILELDTRQVVFVHLGGEAFAARDIQRGRQSNGMVEILSGLAPGEKIV